MNNVVSATQARNIGMQVMPQAAGAESDAGSLAAEFGEILAEDLEIPIEISADAVQEALAVEASVEILSTVGGEDVVAQAEDELEEVLPFADEAEEDADCPFPVTEELDDVPVDIPLAPADVSELLPDEVEQSPESDEADVEMELSPEAEQLLASLAEKTSDLTSGLPLKETNDAVESPEVIEMPANTAPTSKTAHSRVDALEQPATTEEITSTPKTENSAELTETDLPEKVETHKQNQTDSAEKKPDVADLPEAKIASAQEVAAKAAESVAQKAPVARAEKSDAGQKLSQETTPDTKAEAASTAPKSENRPIERPREFQVATERAEPAARAEEKSQAAVVSARHAEPAQPQMTENRPAAQPLIRANVQIVDNQAARFTNTAISPATVQSQSAPTPAEAQPSAAPRILDETHFVENLVRHSKLLTRPDGSSEIRINVKPEDLGPVTVRLNLKNNHLQASVEVEQQDVRHAVESLIPRIRQTLAAEGLSLDKFDVASRRQSDPSEQGSQQNSFDRGGNRSTAQSSGARQDARSSASRAAAWTPTGAMDFIV